MLWRLINAVFGNWATDSTQHSHSQMMSDTNADTLTPNVNRSDQFNDKNVKELLRSIRMCRFVTLFFSFIALLFCCFYSHSSEVVVGIFFCLNVCCVAVTTVTVENAAKTANEWRNERWKKTTHTKTTNTASTTTVPLYACIYRLKCLYQLLGLRWLILLYGKTENKIVERPCGNFNFIDPCSFDRDDKLNWPVKSTIYMYWRRDTKDSNKRGGMQTTYNRACTKDRRATDDAH